MVEEDAKIGFDAQDVEKTSPEGEKAVKNAQQETISAIRYLHEVKKLTYSEIGNRIGKSKAWVIRVRWGKWWAKDEKKGEKISGKIQRVKESFSHG